jgi:MarR family transcriptional regulator for hemolysin
MQDDPNQSIGFIINDVARLLRRNFDRRAQAVGLTRSQWVVLAHLRRTDGLRQTELADLLEVEPITLARLVDRLESDGWVKRQNDANDRRAKRVFLTEKVSPILKQMQLIGKEIREEAMIGMDETKREILKEILLEMRGNLCSKN